jgi:hypothetical protein
MTRDISPNKVSDAEQRRADHIEDRLKKKGMGQDEAEKRALEMAVDEDPRGAGGGPNTAGQPHKETSPGDSRRGSDKEP